MNETEREGCIRIMCGVSSGKMILPKSYYQRIMIPEDVYSSEEGFAGIWIGKSLEAKQRGEDVCIKVFQDQNSDILEKMKKVCDSVRPESERRLITIRSSITQS